MTPWEIVNWVGCLFSLSATSYMIYLIVKVRRKMRELEEREERILELEILLCRIACQTFMQDHQHIWRAWCGTMGLFEVHVVPRPMQDREE